MARRPLASLFVAVLVIASVLAFVHPVGLAEAGNVPHSVGNASGDGDWPTLGFDEANTGNASAVTGPQTQLTTHWSADTDTRYEASPVVTDGTVYVANHTGSLVARDADTGTLEWARQGNFHAEGMAPAVTDGVVYVGNGSHVEALDADTGNRYWQYTTAGQAKTSPAVVDGTVFVGADDGTVYALDARTGSEEWTASTDSGHAPSPAVADDTVYADGGGQTVYALDASDGTQQWQTTVDGVPTPPTVTDGRVYVGTDTGTVYGLAVGDGSIDWTNDLLEDPIFGSPAVADGTVYVGDADSTGSDFWALDAETGSEQWRKDVEAIWASPAVSADTVYVTVEGGSLYGFDPETGEETVAYGMNFGNKMWSSPAIAGGTVYAGVGDRAPGDGGLFAITEEPVARASVSPTTVATGEQVTLDGTVSSDSSLGTITTYEWDVDGDGTTDLTGSQVGTSFDHGGSDVVTLTVTDDRGVSNSTTATVHVANESRGPLADGWPTRGHDARRTGNATATGIVDSARERLHQPVDAVGLPSIAAGLLYVPTDHGLNATNASTGAPVWADSSVGGNPTYAEGVLYAGNATGDGLSGLDAGTGEVVWGSAGDENIMDTPVVVDGTVYATSTPLLPLSSKSQIHAFDRTDGTERWHYETGDVATAPSVADGIVVAGTSHGYVFGLEDGTVRWNESVGSAVQHPPAIANGTVYAGTLEGHVTARNLSTGSEDWNATVGRIVEGSPAVAHDTVFVVNGDDQLTAVDAETGNQAWQRTLPGSSQADPVVANGTVYVGAGDSLYGYAVATGDQIWSQSTPNVRTTSLAVAGDRIYAIGSLEAVSTNLTAYEGTAPTGPTPVAEASAASVGVGEEVSFDADNSTDDTRIASIEWTFDDGHSASGTEATHSFDAAGTYQVTLTVTDAAGYRASEQLSVSVTSDGSGGGAGGSTGLFATDAGERTTGVATDDESTPNTEGPSTVAGASDDATETASRPTTAPATAAPESTAGSDGAGFGPVVQVTAVGVLVALGYRRGTAHS